MKFVSKGELQAKLTLVPISERWGIKNCGCVSVGRVENTDPQYINYPLDPFHRPPFGPLQWTTSWTTFHGPSQFLLLIFKIKFWMIPNYRGILMMSST